VDAREETTGRAVFEMNTAIEDRAVELIIAGASVSDLNVVSDNDKIYLYAFGLPDSVYWIDTFGFRNDGYVIAVKGESAHHLHSPFTPI